MCTYKGWNAKHAETNTNNKTINFIINVWVVLHKEGEQNKRKKERKNIFTLGMGLDDAVR